MFARPLAAPDEPTNHLDIHYQLEILDLVRALGLTTLVTLHDLNLAAAYCQWLYLFKQEHMVASVVLIPELIREVFNVDAVVGQHPITDVFQLSFVALDTVASEAR